MPNWSIRHVLEGSYSSQDVWYELPKKMDAYVNQCFPQRGKGGAYHVHPAQDCSISSQCMCPGINSFKGAPFLILGETLYVGTVLYSCVEL